jgi:hypothetical protein
MPTKPTSSSAAATRSRGLERQRGHRVAMHRGPGPGRRLAGRSPGHRRASLLAAGLVPGSRLPETGRAEAVADDPGEPDGSAPATGRYR